MDHEKVKDWFTSEEQFDTYLADAMNNAESDTEIDFVSTLIRKFGVYKMNTLLSESQKQWLERIADR